MGVDVVTTEPEVPRSRAHEAPQARKEGTSPLMMGMLVLLFGLGVIGIAGASLLLTRR
jgi:hypothetical protein